MAKTAQAKSAFDVTGIITEKNAKKEQTTNINNEHKQQTTNAGFSIEKPQREVKSKRVNLVLQPSLYEKAQGVARANGISFNEMITQILQQITNDEYDEPEADEHEQITIGD